MRKLIVTEFLTLDGVMQDPGGAETADFDRGGWSFKFPDPDGMKFKLDELVEADALLLGRKTYEGFAAAWPGRSDEAGFADKMNAMPKHVVSSTLTDPAWENTTVLEGDVATSVGELKAGEGGAILVAGSRTLVQALAQHDLVDQYRLLMHPILLGAGARMFGDLPGEQVLELVDGRVLGSGSLALVYEPVRG